MCKLLFFIRLQITVRLVPVGMPTQPKICMGLGWRRSSPPYRPGIDAHVVLVKHNASRGRKLNFKKFFSRLPSIKTPPDPNTTSNSPGTVPRSTCLVSRQTTADVLLLGRDLCYMRTSNASPLGFIRRGQIFRTVEGRGWGLRLSDEKGAKAGTLLHEYLGQVRPLTPVWQQQGCGSGVLMCRDAGIVLLQRKGAVASSRLRQ